MGKQFMWVCLGVLILVVASFGQTFAQAHCVSSGGAVKKGFFVDSCEVRK